MQWCPMRQTDGNQKKALWVHNSLPHQKIAVDAAS
jgi:hypothetical protein